MVKVSEMSSVFIYAVGRFKHDFLKMIRHKGLKDPRPLKASSRSLEAIF